MNIAELGFTISVLELRVAQIALRNREATDRQRVGDREGADYL